MSLKKLLENPWKYLPGTSLVEYGSSKDTSSSLKRLGKMLGHLIYFGATLWYLINSAQNGPNPFKWREGQIDAVEYDNIYTQAIKCVDRDEISGLSNLSEINELYSRAGVNTKVGFQKKRAIAEFPKLSKKDLESVVQSCKSDKQK